MRGLFKKLGAKKNADKQSQAAQGNGEVQSSHPRKHERTQQSDSARNTLSLTASVPMDELLKQLNQPASSWAQETAHLVGIRQKFVCSICCNLDPNLDTHPSGSREASWAQEEYNIPSGTLSAVITVEDAKQLFASAGNGCVFCTIVAGALGVALPGWDKEKAYINIHLAVGLPVIVRLQLGTTAKVPMSRAEALNLGVDLPEGQTFEWVITVAKDQPIEFEIYRQNIPAAQLTIGDVVFGRELVPHMGFGEDMSEHSGDPMSFAFIKENVDTCIKQHKCGQDGALPILPDRVLWIEANNPSHIKLLEPTNIRAPFIALSYCWGPTDPKSYMTTASTLEAKKGGIDYRDLPALFQDVIDIARGLGIEYIWIDRLCIIQGDDADFHIQAPKMGQIYGNATLTIAAASASTEHDRILAERGEERLCANLNADIVGLGTLKLATRLVSHTLGKEKKGGDYGKMSTRAWIWQERLLAARTVFFTPTALKYECRCYSIWEGFEKGLTGHSWSAQLDNITHHTWLSLVEEYMRRKISRPSDRLPAMQAVMKRIEKSTGWSPFWGLWASELIEGLCWSAERGNGLGELTCHMNPDHYAPTWSWASVDGPISYLAAKPNSILGPDPIQWDPECRSLNGASGVVRLSGRVLFLNIYGTFKSLADDETESGETWCEYKVSGSQDGANSFPVTADVALKPWTGIIDGQRVSTVVRVPYGEAAPTESWRTICACLLVAKKKLGCIVLFLGQSIREPHAWERVGMASGIAFSAFSRTEKMRIDIV